MAIVGGNIIASITGGVFHSSTISPSEPTESLLGSPADIMYAWLELNGYVSDPTDDEAWPMYTGFLPDDYPKRCPQDALAVFDSDGVIDAKVMQGAVIQKFGIQILARATNYVTGYSKAESLTIALDAIFNESITNGVTTYEIQNVSRRGPVLSMGKDEKRSSMFSLNFLLTLKRIT
jgi:hypothetical protein